ncbi:hypothetical protein JKP88DRAFT_277663 [Tribonema minus]|uniref:Uncharacterized protein n=1 Tax=Tribonema minus TaxID=303371 RepID=A0A836CGY3_9STRA|nr:hypothetical protein JKP88DRAFT_277663 [Tribonema minus]
MSQVEYEDKQLEAVLQRGNGVFRLEKVHREVGADPVGYGPADSRMRLKALNGVAVTGVDSGQHVEVLEVSGELYRTWALSTLNEQKEAARRTANDEYRDACTALAGEHTRTCDIETKVPRVFPADRGPDFTSGRDRTASRTVRIFFLSASAHRGWKEAWAAGEVGQWAPQLGEVVLCYNSCSKATKSSPSIVQVVDYPQTVPDPCLKATDKAKLDEQERLRAQDRAKMKEQE